LVACKSGVVGLAPFPDLGALATGARLLILGDCLDIMPTLPAASVDLILCDLPYGTTQNKWDAVIPLEPLWREYWRIAKPNAAIVLTCAQPFTTTIVASELRAFKYCWVWKKTQAVGHLNAWKQPMRNTEDIAVFYRMQCTYNPVLTDKPKKNQRPQTARTRTSDNYGEHKLDVYKCPPDKNMPSTILEFANAQKTVHPTQKPVDLMEYLIRTYTDEGDTVLDSCMGSGTTGVAALKCNRKFIGIERDPEYFEIAKNRIGVKRAKMPWEAPVQKLPWE
jgi:site-specific DNA-methyltransferase (adenine-specific)